MSALPQPKPSEPRLHEEGLSFPVGKRRWMLRAQEACGEKDLAMRAVEGVVLVVVGFGLGRGENGRK